MSSRIVTLLVFAAALACTDGTAPTTGTPPPAPPPPSPPPPPGPLTLALLPVASGLDRPLDLTAPTNDPRLFVAEQTGAIRIIDASGVRATPFLDLSGVVSCCSERGLLGIAFHPDYPTDGRVFVSYTRSDGTSRIASYRVSGDPNVASPVETIILEVPQPASNHNGGQLAFGRDGSLYISLGDGGVRGTAQDRGVLLGSILRIDVDGAGPYAIPVANPYRGHPTFREELWNYGLRNPWRFSFDRQTGTLYIADVGETEREEINVQEPEDGGGQNYGWNVMEGTTCFRATTCDQTGLVLPVAEYEHLGGACSVTGGYVYRGTALPELAGTYFYGDFCAGWVRSFVYAGGQATAHTTWSSLATGGSLRSFGQDAAGELYVLAGGTVSRIVRGP